jgi:hypothetical protein
VDGRWRSRTATKPGKGISSKSQSWRLPVTRQKLVHLGMKFLLSIKQSAFTF